MSCSCVSASVRQIAHPLRMINRYIIGSTLMLVQFVLHQSVLRIHDKKCFQPSRGPLFLNVHS